MTRKNRPFPEVGQTLYRAGFDRDDNIVILEFEVTHVNGRYGFAAGNANTLIYASRYGRKISETKDDAVLQLALKTQAEHKSLTKKMFTVQARYIKVMPVTDAYYLEAMKDVRVLEALLKKSPAYSPPDTEPNPKRPFMSTKDRQHIKNALD